MEKASRSSRPSTLGSCVPFLACLLGLTVASCQTSHFTLDTSTWYAVPDPPGSPTAPREVQPNHDVWRAGAGVAVECPSLTVLAAPSLPARSRQEPSPAAGWQDPEGQSLEGLEQLPNTLEGLSDTPIPVRDVEVESATFYAIPLHRSPSAISILDHDDVRGSAAYTLPQLLRRIPGVDVIQKTTGGAEIQIRGDGRTPLLMVDGMNLYWELFGLNFWDALPVSLAEIEKIEVMRGPSSSLHGANAFSGIISIETRRPEDVGTEFHQSVGSYGIVETTALHGQRLANGIGYKASARWSQRNEFRNNLGTTNRDELGLQAGTGRLQFYVPVGDVDELQVGAFYHDRIARVQPAQTTAESNGYDLGLQSRLDIGQWRFDASWLHRDTDVTIEGIPGRPNIVDDVIELSGRRTFLIEDDQRFTAGASFRHTRNDTANLLNDSIHERNLYSLFAQHELDLGDHLRVHSSLRVENRFHADGLSISPRIGAVFEPAQGHALRFSWSRAYNNPTFVEQNIQTTFELTNPAPPPPLVQVPLVGNRRLAPVLIDAFEVGWRFDPSTSTWTNLNVFLNDLDHQIRSSLGPAGITFSDRFDNVVWGAEAEVGMRLSDWEFFTNYTYQDSRRMAQTIMPRHKASCGARYSGDGPWRFDASAHWIDADRFHDDTPTWYTSDEALILQARLGYHLDEPDLEIYVSGFNILNDRHREVSVGDVIGATFMIGIILGL